MAHLVVNVLSVMLDLNSSSNSNLNFLLSLSLGSGFFGIHSMLLVVVLIRKSLGPIQTI